MPSDRYRRGGITTTAAAAAAAASAAAAVMAHGPLLTHVVSAGARRCHGYESYRLHVCRPHGAARSNLSRERQVVGITVFRPTDDFYSVQPATQPASKPASRRHDLLRCMVDEANYRTQRCRYCVRRKTGLAAATAAARMQCRSSPISLFAELTITRRALRRAAPCGRTRQPLFVRRCDSESVNRNRTNERYSTPPRGVL